MRCHLDQLKCGKTNYKMTHRFYKLFLQNTLQQPELQLAKLFQRIKSVLFLDSPRLVML